MRAPGNRRPYRDALKFSHSCQVRRLQNVVTHTTRHTTRSCPLAAFARTRELIGVELPGRPAFWRTRLQNASCLPFLLGSLLSVVISYDAFSRA